MLKVDQIHVIRHKVKVEGQSCRRVARDMRVSRNTVKKYLKMAEPVRTVNKPRSRPAVEAVLPRIEEIIEEWKSRVTPKQRLTGTRLHQQLQDEGFDVGVTIVREIFRELKRKRMEVFIPLVHRPGEEAQVDFFDVVIEEDGVRRRVWKFLMHLMHSGKDFVWLYERCDQVSFLDGHVRAFAHFGAIPRRCVYDNLSAAVKKVALPQRELTIRFKSLINHYLFEASFARVGEGHDKGGVESRGKGLRLQHLTPIPQGKSLQEIAAAVLESVDKEAARRRRPDGITVLELFEAERSEMLSLPETPFEARLMVPISISSKSTFQLDGVTYSLPSHWARLSATAYVGPTDIRFICRSEVHVKPRLRRGERCIRYRDYLVELARKPQAVRQVAPELTAELGEPFLSLWELLVGSHGPKEASRVFAKVLSAVVDHGEERVGKALSETLQGDRPNLLALQPRREQNATIQVPGSLAGHTVEMAHAADYDYLLLRGAA